jgi:alpha-tubulin suppressor-like RCC1 family protein
MIRSCRGRIAGVAAAVLVISMSACYEPSFEPCTVTCGEGDTCPGGMECVAGLCAEAGQSCVDTSEPLLRTVAAGAGHACALIDGDIVCWGDNAFNQLARPVTTDGGDPAAVVPPGAGAGQWISLAAGARHTCALFDPDDDTAPGQIRCWGDNALGQLGVEDGGNQFGHPSVDGLDWISIGAGDQHSCGIAKDPVTEVTSIYCWGDNLAGQLDGNAGGQAPGAVAVTLPAGAEWRAVDGGARHTCAVAENGDALCWGDNSRGQLGTAAATATAPQEVPGRYAMIAGGGDHSCGVQLDAGITCWGDNTNGRLGTASAEAFLTAPTDVLEHGADSGWSVLEASATTTCGIAGGAAYCWGDDALTQGAGRLGTAQLAPATAVIGLTSPRDIAPTLVGGCANADDVKCWGDSPQRQLGDGTLTIGFDVREVIAPTGLEWQTVVAGNSHTCAVATATGTAQTYCWGLSDHGEAGVAVEDEINATPTQMEAAGTTSRRVAVGDHHTCNVQDPAGEIAPVTCWGDDSRDQILDGPAAMLTFTDGATITADRDYTCVTGVSSHIPKCWGTPDDDLDHRSATPIELSTNNQMIVGSVTWGARSLCGIKNLDATANVYCVGSEEAGELGNGAGTPLEWPESTMIPSMSMVAILGGGPGRTRCAGFATGDVRCWGDNSDGQVTPAAPGGDVQSPTTTTDTGTLEPISLSAGARHVCAVNSDGNLSCWGARADGQRSETPPSAEPSTIDQPDGIADWTAVSAGGSHTCALGDDGAALHLFCWGRNTYGQIGAGTNTARGSATAISWPL